MKIKFVVATLLAVVLAVELSAYAANLATKECKYEYLYSANGRDWETQKEIISGWIFKPNEYVIIALNPRDASDRFRIGAMSYRLSCFFDTPPKGSGIMDIEFSFAASAEGVTIPLLEVRWGEVSPSCHIKSHIPVVSATSNKEGKISMSFNLDDIETTYLFLGYLVFDLIPEKGGLVEIKLTDLAVKFAVERFYFGGATYIKAQFAGRGDLNADGIVNEQDMKVWSFFFKKMEECGCGAVADKTWSCFGLTHTAMDVDSDGVITPADLVKLGSMTISAFAAPKLLRLTTTWGQMKH